MAEIEINLAKGLLVGDEHHRCARIREASAQDIIEASGDAERLVMVPIGFDDNGKTVTEPQLVVSPALMGIHTLRRQITAIGKIKGPIELSMLYMLSAEDLHELQRTVEDLERAAAAELANRGRSDAQGELDHGVDQPTEHSS